MGTLVVVSVFASVVSLCGDCFHMSTGAIVPAILITAMGAVVSVGTAVILDIRPPVADGGFSKTQGGIKTITSRKQGNK